MGDGFTRSLANAGGYGVFQAKRTRTILAYRALIVSTALFGIRRWPV